MTTEEWAEEWAEEWKAGQFKEDMMDIDIIRYFGAAYIMESDLPPKEKCNMIDYVKEAKWDEILNLVFNGNKPSRKLTINEQYILEAQAENFIYPLIFKYMSEGNRKGRKKPTRKEKQAAAAAKAKFGSGSPTPLEVKKAPVTAAKKVKKTVQKIAKEAPPASGKKVQKAAKQVEKASVQIDKAAGAVLTKTKEYAEKGFKGTKKGYYKYKPGAKRYAVGASVLVLIASATAAAHRVYKIYLTKAARDCKGRSGSERRDCIVRYRKTGYQAKINTYAKARSDCAASKNPERCKRHLDDKIKKAKYKIATLYSRL